METSGFLQLRPAVLFGLAMVLAGCGGGSGAPAALPSPVDSGSEDIGIARAVYGIDPPTPGDFYRDPQPYPDRQTFTVHIRKNEVHPGQGGMNYEECTDDFAEALSWSEINAAAQGLATSLTGNSENEWYYQFDRAIEASEPAMLINRAFKCSTIDRSGVSDSGDAGAINRRPLGAADVRWIAEYLWGFSSYNNALNAVISSSGHSTSDRLEHRILRASAIRFAGTGGCDIIEIWSLDYSADRTTGVLVYREDFVRMFEARYENGQASLCE